MDRKASQQTQNKSPSIFALLELWRDTVKYVFVLIIAIAGFVIGALFLAPAPVSDVMASGRSTQVDSGSDLTGHVASVAFGLLAAWLLIKNTGASKRNQNDLVMMFSIGILTTIFGRYVGDIALPEFLRLPR